MCVYICIIFIWYFVKINFKDYRLFCQKDLRSFGLRTHTIYVINTVTRILYIRHFTQFSHFQDAIREIYAYNLEKETYGINTFLFRLTFCNLSFDYVLFFICSYYFITLTLNSLSFILIMYFLNVTA